MSLRRAEAVALPLTVETLRAVVVRARRVGFAQLAGFGALSVGFGWMALRSEGTAAAVPGAVAALSLWGVLGAGLSLWDHFRVSRVLAQLSAADLAAEADVAKFWWRHRGVFAMSWDNR